MQHCCRTPSETSFSLFLITASSSTALSDFNWSSSLKIIESERAYTLAPVKMLRQQPQTEVRRRRWLEWSTYALYQNPSADALAYEVWEEETDCSQLALEANY